MREIIHIGLGNCGVRIGCKFYEQLIQDYQIENNRTCEKPAEGIEVHFSEIGDKKFVPRSILCSRDVEQILANPQSLIFNPNNYQLELDESLRKEMEICDNCQGIQITHHLSTDISMLQDLLQHYDKVIQTFTIFPNQEYGHDIVKSAQSLRFLEGLNVVAFDNSGLNEYYARQYKSTLTFNDYNALVATVMNSVTSPMRQSNTYNLEKMYSVQSQMNVEVCKLVQDKQSQINLQQMGDTKLLIETNQNVNEKIIQATLLARTNQLTPNQLHQQLQSTAKSFYNNIINLNYQISPYKQEILVSLYKSSHIKFKLQQLKNNTQLLQTRKAFNEVYQWDENQGNLEYLNKLVSLCDQIVNTHQEQQQQQQQQSSVQASSPISVSENKMDRQRDYIKSSEQVEASPKKQITVSQSIALGQPNAIQQQNVVGQQVISRNG
ncbi:unnamed protein product (macronuclear) [Paramecium tetraurelia]|uniref:Beta_tubulin,putative n=1 Tax=Paramecium tetraurelia TaxID=5888 RepID=Q3SEG6_PARTE|nr:uncharacterized protein GSPATT00007518001 [Paramecium tetraurelia]CAI38958.1 beta_tubulin,putative [Paramecium tetraurelia]CAK70078.1 unnamed protein product [Paramecium tetraurelia]|eukprot:XP_001437475.1 hypothetical protein (macronuclear) [Paramecium tetraurelia strain d4-2]